MTGDSISEISITPNRFYAMETWITFNTQFIRSKMFTTKKKTMKTCPEQKKKKKLSNIVKETVVNLPINHSKFLAQEIC